MTVCGIYQIRNTTNGHRYIGSSFDIKARFGVHSARLKVGKHHSKHLQSAYRKYGPEAFEFSVLFLCDKDALIPFEQRAIDGLRPEYNMKPNADRRQTCLTAEQRAKISATLMGHPVSAETRAKMSAKKAGKAPWNKGLSIPGHPHTEEEKEKMRGPRFVSEESHRRRSEAARLWHAAKKAGQT